ncbi:MAG TPA: hypothetical protein VJB34_03355 [Bdellovibrionota bacterium]|nr:hypothetical protein [Bdellovibrionota bacterium]
MKVTLSKFTSFILVLSLYLGVSYAALETRRSDTDSTENEDAVLKIHADYGPNTFIQGYYDGKRLRFFKFDKADEGRLPGMQWTNKKGEYTGGDPNEVEQTLLDEESLSENEEAFGAMSMENPDGGKLLGVSYVISKPDEFGDKKIKLTLHSTKSGNDKTFTHEVVLKKNPITKKWELYNNLEYTTGTFKRTTHQEFSRLEAIQFHIAGWSEEGARISKIYLEGKNGKGEEREKTIEFKEEIPLNLEPETKSSYCPPSDTGVGDEVVDERSRVKRVFQAADFI